MSAELIVAGVSATLQAVQTWFQVRDSKRAGVEFHNREAKIDDPAMMAAAARLTSIVPQPILDSIQTRLDQCWTGYQKVLDRPDEYTPSETDDATKAVIKCVCREIKRVRDLSGGNVPEGPMREFAAKHSCG
jgi:hypothetical protein